MSFLRKYWITILLFLFGLFFILQERGYTQEYRIPCEMEAFFAGDDLLFRLHEARGQKCSPIRLPSTDAQKAEYQELWDFHMFHGKRCYQDAYDRVWWLPEKTWREKGRTAWQAACATVTAGTPQLRVVAIVITFLCKYGLDCMDEWDYVAEKLHWAEFHFKECEKYAELMNW